MRVARWLTVPTTVLSAVSGLYATEYLTVEQAQKALFPDAERFDAQAVDFTKEQRRAIQKSAKTSVPAGPPHVWKALGGGVLKGYVWVDRVIGKHELITYAVALHPDGSVKQVEIMDYRETYGGEVQRKAWRDQFVGKTAADPLKLDRDIRNISGATLSSRNVATGVRRILASHAALFAQ